MDRQLAGAPHFLFIGIGELLIEHFKVPGNSSDHDRPSLIANKRVRCVVCRSFVLSTESGLDSGSFRSYNAPASSSGITRVPGRLTLANGMVNLARRQVVDMHQAVIVACAPIFCFISDSLALSGAAQSRIPRCTFSVSRTIRYAGSAAKAIQQRREPVRLS